MLVRGDPSYRMAWWHSVGMEDRRHGLNPVADARSRPNDNRIAVDGPNRDAGQFLRDHFSMFERVVDLGCPYGAHTAQVLGEDQFGIEIGERALGQRVEVVACGELSAHI